MLYLEYRWFYTIRELAQLWCLSRKQVCQVLDDEPRRVHSAEVTLQDGLGRFQRTVVYEWDAFEIYANRVLPLLPPDTDPLTTEDSRLLFAVLGLAAGAGLMGTPAVWCNDINDPMSALERRGAHGLLEETAFYLGAWVNCQ